MDDPARLATFDQHRGSLFSVAYRMLGSVADAEDVLQEAFIRWQRASEEEIRSPKAFLVTIVSRLCINHLESARVRREEYVGQWLPEPMVTDPASDPSGVFGTDETLSMAFLVLLERLTPVERAVFLLREIFDYEYAEIATILNRSEVNCRQIFRRARQHVRASRPRFRKSPGEHDQLLQRFLQAATNGDMDALVELLSSDVVLQTDGGGKAPALPNVIHGASSVARAIVGGVKRAQAQGAGLRQIVQVNGEPGIVTYRNGRPFSVLVLHVSDGHVGAIYIVTNPAKLSHLPQAPS
jgi:RNA polymerase sigma-70 factor (ECF subfamily)